MLSLVVVHTVWALNWYAVCIENVATNATKGENMSSIMNEELREFIELARADTGEAKLEEAWVSAFRSFLSQTSRDRLAAAKHRIDRREEANDLRVGESWSEWELDLAFNPNYSYTQVARHLGRTPESVIAARKRHRKQRRDRLQELTDIMDGKYD